MGDTLMPLAMGHNYTQAEVWKLLRDVPTDQSGKMDFAAMQDVILASQRRRLEILLKDGAVERGHRCGVPYQSKASEALMAVTRKKKLNVAEENLSKIKRLGCYGTLVAGLEEQNLGSEIAANVTLCRSLGSVDDRWDRYCALRRQGKSSYVGARNTPRQVGCHDDGLADK